MSRPQAAGPRGILKADWPAGPHARQLPAEDLAGFVAHFWSLGWDLQGQAPRVVQTLPHPSVHVVFESAQPARVTGVQRGRFTRILEGKARVFGIKFRPGGFYPYWRKPLSTLTDRTLPLIEVLGADAPSMEAGILAADSDESRIEAAESFLRARMPPADGNVAIIDDLVRHIVADPSITQVKDLTSHSGLGNRALQRLFQTYVGISPKWMIQRYRLHEALQRLDTLQTPNWAEFALALGYFDQAHFIHDFRTVVGKTPAQYLVAPKAAAPSANTG